jgi:hypothetical protein
MFGHGLDEIALDAVYGCMYIIYNCIRRGEILLLLVPINSDINVLCRRKLPCVVMRELDIVVGGYLFIVTITGQP